MKHTDAFSAVLLGDGLLPQLRVEPFYDHDGFSGFQATFSDGEDDLHEATGPTITDALAALEAILAAEGWAQ